MSRRTRLKVITRGELEALPFVPIELPGSLAWMRRYHEANPVAYRWGDCTVIVTREYGEWHLSIAHPDRFPTWDECAVARYRLIPDGVTMAMILPPRRAYVNIHRNCFQMVEIPDRDGERPQYVE